MICLGSNTYEKLSPAER